MQAKIKKIGILLIGWAFILLGIAGLFLPVLQGILFLVIGLFILSSEYVWAHHLLQAFRQRFPRIDARWEEIRVKAHKWTGKVFHHTSD